MSSYNQSLEVDQTQLRDFIKDLDKIRKKFNERKVLAIAMNAAKPMAAYMKGSAPVNTTAEYIKPKNHWSNYRPGTLRRSIARWSFHGGVLVGARIGNLNKKVRGKPNYDGWYVHLAHDTHGLKGGGRTTQATPFVDHAFQATKGITTKLMISEAKRIIKFGS